MRIVHPRYRSLNGSLYAVMLGLRLSAQDPCPVVSEVKRVDREVGLNAFAWVDWNPAMFVVAKGYASVGNGVFYALQSRRNVARIGIEVFHYTYTEGSRPAASALYPWYDYSEGRSTVFDGYLGYQRLFISGRFRPYAGADIHLRYVVRVGAYEGESDWPPYQYSGPEKSHSTQVALSPVVGLRVRLFDRVFLYWEASCLVGVAWTTDEVRARTFRDNLLLLNPVRALGFSYLF